MVNKFVQIYGFTAFDRNGFKREDVFNAAGNLVAKKEYTNLNLRAGAADYFETLYTYNDNSLMTSVK